MVRQAPVPRRLQLQPRFLHHRQRRHLQQLQVSPRRQLQRQPLSAALHQQLSLVALVIQIRQLNL